MISRRNATKIDIDAVGSPARRTFLATGGALVVSFSLAPAAFAQASTEKQAPQNRGETAQKAPALPGSLEHDPLLDAWIRIDANGAITVFTGKAELGQGIKTALIQVAAEQLVVEPSRITLVTADTARTPNEGYTAGSQSMQHSGTAIMNAAAQVRAILVGLAASKFELAAEQLRVQDGVVHGPNGLQATYASLVTGDTLHVRATPQSPLIDPAKHRVMGTSMPRVDIPGKVTGAPSYVQDLRMPGMVHARAVRPPSYGAKLAAVDAAAVEAMPGVLKIVRDGSYLAVVAAREYQAIAAMRALARRAKWDERATLAAEQDPYANLQRLPSHDRLDAGASATPLAGDGVVKATFRRPYQMHASIGPSCAVGLAKDGAVTIWTHSQGVYPLRGAIAELLHLPKERVHCIHVEGSGCYGHNAADDAAADAALIAVAFPGRAVRVQWMREDEHAFEPYGSAMLAHAQARIDASGRVAEWRYEVWSHTHSTRPGPAGNLMPAWFLREPFAQPEPSPIPLPAGGGDRNAIAPYKFGKASVLYHFVPAMPTRVSALRSLGSYGNVFAIESFIDELASVARSDPVEFRLRHLDDPRAIDVVRAAADRFGWTAWDRKPGHGRGFAYARYKTLAAYAAVAMDVDVERASGNVHVSRVVVAVDSGDAVNPDGIRNQMEGGVVQSLSWTLFERVMHDGTRITSRDWSGYPILRFPDLPDQIDVHVIDRPGAPFLGTGEAAQGVTAAALANAIADATGVRVRDLPFDRDRLRTALGPVARA
ncbi:MAG TPA: molybdopterin cofactor-binding domain-containing protein [Casimicrobiaceae bacterium]|nr:molybdopterin cofactor-binding domain-containing protein [Casimicrobiaceae bacterium]